MPVGITQCLNALNAACSGPLGSKAQNQPIQNQIRAVLPKERFRSFDKAFAGKTRVPIEEIFDAWSGY